MAAGRAAERAVLTFVEATAEAAGAAAAAHAGDALRAALAARGRAALALSGGRTPAPLLAALARERLDWSRVQVFQADERCAPDGDPARNLAAIAAALVAGGSLPAECLHAMPVDDPQPQAALAAYARRLLAAAGDPPVLDLVQLGLGADGHTASLFAGDPALEVTDCPVTFTGAHGGFRRMTLTLPTINAAREVLWFVTGADKRAAFAALRQRTLQGPAVRVERTRAVAYLDAAAAGVDG